MSFVSDDAIFGAEKYYGCTVFNGINKMISDIFRYSFISDAPFRTVFISRNRHYDVVI